MVKKSSKKTKLFNKALVKPYTGPELNGLENFKKLSNGKVHGGDIKETFLKEVGDFPFYAFFLYSDEDKDVVEFMSQKSPWLHCLSNNDCLIYVFENPSEWPEEWMRCWQEMYGSEFDKKYAEWQKITPFIRTQKTYELADHFRVEKDHIPCMVFVDNSNNNRTLEIPFVANKADYHKYFSELFTCVHKAVDASSGLRLTELQKEYYIHVWAHWILPPKVKGWSESIQKCGSIIRDTEDAVLDVIKPFLTALLPAGIGLGKK